MSRYPHIVRRLEVDMVAGALAHIMRDRRSGTGTINVIFLARKLLAEFDIQRKGEMQTDGPAARIERARQVRDGEQRAELEGRLQKLEIKAARKLLEDNGYLVYETYALQDHDERNETMDDGAQLANGLISGLGAAMAGHIAEGVSGFLGYKPENATLGVKSDGTMSDGTEALVRQGILLLAKSVSNCAHAHGWWSDDDGQPKERNIGEMIALMHSELSEALEAYRNGEPVLWYEHKDPTSVPIMHNNWSSKKKNDQGELGKPQGIASEFADTIIRILDTCETLKIPVTEALIDKAHYNISRPYRHGGKLI